MISFQNQGEAELKALLTMGVSVKEKSDSIGKFGTGFKYAVAIILRLGGSIDLYIGKEKYTFFSKKEEIRGQEHDLVFLRMPSGESRELGFTTHYGHSWEPWMAYRELRSNTMDENGSIWDSPHTPMENTTTIHVRSDTMDRCHSEKDYYFCGNLPVLFENDYIIIRANPKEIGGLFYRGVRVLEDSHIWTYNYDLKGDLHLTEDRQCSFQSGIRIHLSSALGTVTDEKFCLWMAKAVDTEGLIENELICSYLFSSSNEMGKMLRKLGSQGSLGSKAQSYASALFSDDYLQFFIPDELDQKRVDRAMRFLSEVFGTTTEIEIKFADNLPGGQLGQYRSDLNVIYITRRCLNSGTKMLAGTLYEEILHATTGLRDETRFLQNYLVDALMSCGERVWKELL